MQPLSKADCKGNWGTLLLPINADDTIDYRRLSDEIDALISAGVNGIYSNGTAGEFHTQTEAEFDQVNQLLADKCNAAGMAFQIGVSHAVPQTMIARIERTRVLAPSAYQVVLPDWVGLNDAEVIRFFSKIAATAGTIPLVFYNPPHAKRVLSPAAYQSLLNNVPTLISIKLLDGDELWYGEMKEVAGRAAVFVPGHHLATGVSRGLAAGAYSNVACINPAAAQEWWQLMEADLQEALRIEQQIQYFFEVGVVPFAKAGFSNPALDKLLAATGGWADIGTRLRWPYQWIPENEVAAVRKVAQRLLPGWMQKL
ncbi:dihydrodipicolinate synthase family protein [Niabella insulamsoli]|uniref:dihydrodipicolinate synthase family protein n=1 Tax=Niabella insulamsoli TaxID=3144874 RepID=UPI0031FC37D7